MANKRSGTNEMDCLGVGSLATNGCIVRDLTPEENLLIDNQEQDQIIFDLKQECIQQAQNMETWLPILCYTSGFISLTTLSMHTFNQTTMMRFYPVFVAVLYVAAGRKTAHSMKIAVQEMVNGETNPKSDNDVNFSGMSAVNVMVAILPVILHLKTPQAKNDWWIWIIFGSNIYIYIAIHILQKDLIITKRSLESLNNSRYKHKSL